MRHVGDQFGTSLLRWDGYRVACAADGRGELRNMIRRWLFGVLIVVALGAGPALAAGNYFVQLASVRSDESARKEWTRLQKVHPALLDDLALEVQRADLGDRGIFYRIRTGPFPNRATAQDMCAQIEAAKLACLVVLDK